MIYLERELQKEGIKGRGPIVVKAWGWKMISSVYNLAKRELGINNQEADKFLDVVHAGGGEYKIVIYPNNPYKAFRICQGLIRIIEKNATKNEITPNDIISGLWIFEKDIRFKAREIVDELITSPERERLHELRREERIRIKRRYYELRRTYERAGRYVEKMFRQSGRLHYEIEASLPPPSANPTDLCPYPG